MSYKNFTVKKAVDTFDVSIAETVGIFSGIPERAISQHLTETLIENVPLAIAINTEKARSELIIMPVLVELRKLFKHQISLFSGVELNVDRDKELNGFCDFIVSLSSEQLFLKAPILVIVEAKNENVMSGLGQCIAEMIAAKMYNAQEAEIKDKTVYGIVTSGNIWKFLKLKNEIIHIELEDYSIKEISKIIGILSGMVEQTA